MKAIYPDKISSLAASTENANYPASNCTNNFQLKVWKATSATATLTIDVAADGDAVAIFNTNADDITIYIQDSGGGAIEDYSKTLSSYAVRNFWQDYSTQATAHKVVIDFTAPDGEIVEVGVVHVGDTESFFVDPDFGISESLLDFSVIKTLNNGAVDIDPKRTLRVFDGRLLVTRDTGFYQILVDYIDATGDTIKAFSITDEDYVYWTVLGWFRTPPRGSHDYYTKSFIDFQIEESP